MTLAWSSRHWNENKSRRDDHRSPYQRDRARVLHSAAFRRLQAKTQIHGVGSSDFYRTRLTHSLEASQIGSGIHAQLKLKYPELHDIFAPVELIETLCLAHDLGHPPFGHGGEIALHYMMHPYGGFEGNGQTFRIVTKLEPYTESYGMNLARRSLLGLVKYPVMVSQVSKPIEQQDHSCSNLKSYDWHPPKALFDCDQDWFDWLLEPLTEQDKSTFTSSTARKNEHAKAKYKSLDCSIMELADDIAYGIHDLEDAITLRMVQRDQWQQAEQSLQELGDEWLAHNISTISEQLFSHQPFIRKNAIGALVNYFITAIKVQHNPDFAEPLLAYNAKLSQTAHAALKVFKDFVYQHVIKAHRVQTAEYKGQQMIMRMFEAYACEPTRLLPADIQQIWHKQQTEEQQMRVIADWVSSLTDQSAKRIYNELFA